MSDKEVNSLVPLFCRTDLMPSIISLRTSSSSGAYDLDNYIQKIKQYFSVAWSVSANVHTGLPHLSRFKIP